MSAHTPGPWSVSLSTQDPPQIEAADCMVATIESISDDGAEELANANLIAAAPMAAETCRAIITQIDAIAAQTVPTPVAAVLGSIKQKCEEFLVAAGVDP